MSEVEELLKELSKYMKSKGWELENFIYGSNEASMNEEVLILVYTRKYQNRWN